MMNPDEMLASLREAKEKIEEAKDSADSAKESAAKASERIGNAENEAEEANTQAEDAISLLESLEEAVEEMAKNYAKTEEDIKARVTKEAREMLKSVVIEMVAKIFPETAASEDVPAPEMVPAEQGA